MYDGALSNRRPLPEGGAIQGPPEVGASPSTPLRRANGVLRIATHLGIWTALVVPAAVLSVRGWRPLGDFAVISEQAFAVFSSHSPLVGQITQFSPTHGHPVYDPGPLEYWLLAVPVHMNSGTGALWGAALSCGVILSAATEALWAAVGGRGCVVLAVIVLDLAWTVPAVFTELVWNPYFGLLFLVASLMLAWAVAVGDLRWWPVLVLAASVAAQSHLLYAPVALVVTAGAPIVGSRQAGPRRRSHWLVVGLVVGVVCWLPPAAQQLFGHPGNVGAILSPGPQGPVLGLATGLRAIGTSLTLPPLWLTHPPHTLHQVTSLVLGRSPFLGVVTVALFGLVGAAAWRTQRTALAVLALVGLVLSLGLAFPLGQLPVENVVTLAYLDATLWVTAVVLWAVVIWGGVELGRALASVLTVPGVWSKRRPATASTERVGAGMVAIVIVWFFSLSLVAFSSPDSYYVSWAGVAAANQITTGVKHLTPPGGVLLRFTFTNSDVYQEVGSGLGAGWQLTAAGWQTGMFQPGRTPGLAISRRRDRHWPRVRITMVGNHVLFMERLEGPIRRPTVIGTWRP